MIHTSTKLSPITAINDHCGTGACMNILNYFWGTTFSLKDTFDIETMIRFGHFDWNERPSETEILYFLAQLGFKIELYSQDVEDWELYIWDVEWHEKKHGYVPHPLVNKERSLLATKKLSQHQNFSLTEDTTLDIPTIIRKKSDGKHMFLFGLDGASIYSNSEFNNEITGHIMSSLGYTSSESEYIWLLETSPAAEIIERTYDQIYTAQRVFSPNYAGPKGEITVISLV